MQLFVGCVDLGERVAKQFGVVRLASRAGYVLGFFDVCRVEEEMSVGDRPGGNEGVRPVSLLGQRLADDGHI